MARLPLSVRLVASCALVCSSHRIKSRSLDFEPVWCKDVNPADCKPNQLKMCPDTCAGKTQTEAVRAAVKADRDKIPMEAVTEDMQPIHLNKVKRSDLYKQAWPESCDGKNGAGDIIVNLNTDRFLCYPESNEVAEITSPGWRQAKRSNACCGGKCKHPKACGHNTYTFSEAAKASLARYALKADHVKTESGKRVQVNVEESTEEEISATGVHATVEVRLFSSAIQFVVAEPTFQNASAAFFDELVQTLGPLISMQISAFDIPAKTLLCAHSETSRTYKTALLKELPTQRAQTLRNGLEKYVPEDVADLGDPVGHFAGEVPGYTAGRRAFIIYKIYDSHFPTPKCEHSDLHPFLNKFADQGS